MFIFICIYNIVCVCVYKREREREGGREEREGEREGGRGGGRGREREGEREGERVAIRMEQFNWSLSSLLHHLDTGLRLTYS